MSYQEDMASDLRDEMAVLQGKHCQCGEPKWIASSKAGELEYVNHKVNPLPLIILTEANREFYRIKVSTPMLHLPWPIPTCWSQLMTLWKSWDKKMPPEMLSRRPMRPSRSWLLRSHCPFKSRDQCMASREQSGERVLKRIPIC